MRIAIVTYSLKIGGVENVILNLSESFISNGLYVEILETLETGIWKKKFTDRGFCVKSIVKKPFISAIQHVKRIAVYLNDFDIILLNDAPYAQSILGLLRPEILVFPIMHLSIPSMAINASGNKGQWNKIISVSPLLKDYLLNQPLDLKDTDIICIPNGIDLNEFKPILKKSLTKKKILYLGRISEEKGVLLIPQIIDSIKNNSSFDILDIYGSGSLDMELRELVNSLKLNLKVNFKGAIPHEDISKIITNYDIVLMPSYKEGHPIVLLEAMASGLVPVVSLLSGSTDIVVEHESNGYLCESGNIDEFVINLSKALDNSSHDNFALNARKTIENNYGKDIMRDNYLNLFHAFSGIKTNRTNKIDLSLVGDYPTLPYIFVRVVRKLNKIMHRTLKNTY